MKHKKLLLLPLMALLLVGCGGKADPTTTTGGDDTTPSTNTTDHTDTTVVPTVESVTIATPSKAEVTIGGNLTLTATVAPAGASQGITWSATPTGKVTISASGVVTGVAEGEVTVKAAATADLTKFDEIVITVVPAVIDTINATLAYPSGTTANMTATGNAATVGLNAAIFEVDAVPQKSGSYTNYPGLNKEGQVRLYGINQATYPGIYGSGFSVKLTAAYAATHVIQSIEVQIGANTNSLRVTNAATSDATSMLYDGTEIYNGTPTADAKMSQLTINANQFSIQNVASTSSPQIYIILVNIVCVAR